MTRLPRLGAAGLALVAGLGLLSGCTNDEPYVDKGVPTGSYRLVAFDTCDDALEGLREATKATAGPYGLFGNVTMEGDAVGAAPPGVALPQAGLQEGRSAARPGGADRGAPEASRPNNPETGVGGADP